MPFRKLSYYGNQFIGIFGRTNNKVTVVPVNASERFYKISEHLKTKSVNTMINGSELIGLYMVMNDRCALLSPVVSEQEEFQIKKQLKEEGIEVSVLETKHSAIGNNILVNNTKAVINPRIAEDVAKEIGDLLDVEVMKMKIAGHTTVGSAALATNKGFIAHPEIKEEEFSKLSEFLGLKGGIGTANKGVPYVPLSVISNDNHSVFGEATTGFEIQRILGALDQQ